ncbi:MAG: HD domain-containing protein, partial [Firmicutes bacterium]|nr:HD domain-containing protein [Bacillota bacterium]
MLKLHKAITWACENHKGETSNYTDEPYAAHLMEMIQILAAMNGSEDLQVAGVLHGAVEKNRAAVELFWPLFGNSVAVLLDIYDPGVTAENWRWKKQRLLEKLELADRETQLLVMADCVADLRALTCSYRACDSRTWRKTGVKREDLSWYYSEVQDTLCDLQDDEEARDVYWEFVDLYKDLFVTYYLNDEEGILYQIAHGLYGYAMSREELMWTSIEDQIPENAEVIPREEAEGLEELWTTNKEEFYHDETLEGNEQIEAAISDFRKKEDRETLENLTEVMARRIEERGHLIMPIEDGIEEGNIVPRTITTDDGE